MNQITLHYYYEWITDETKASIQELCDYELNHKFDIVAKKLLKNPNSTWSIKINIALRDGQFDGIFDAIINGHHARYQREKFANLNDLIVHAFDHLKNDYMKLNNKKWFSAIIEYLGDGFRYLKKRLWNK